MDKELEVAYARKYRPTSFSEYLGEDIKKAIMNRFRDESNYPQTILLYGSMGSGKTSMARLMAKEYLCLSKEDGHACGKCQMCQEIDDKLINGEAGVEVLGVTEADIASDSGKSDMDRLLEEALIPPAVTKYSIYILDEVHMASKGSQNRLLKIMEQPPKHLVFILCTTNPEGLLDTVRGRCQVKLEVKKPSASEIADRLLYICQKERIKTSVEALKAIAVHSDRIIRDSIQLLEEIAKENGFTVDINAVRKKTGAVASEVYMEYYKCANKSLEDIIGFKVRLDEMDIHPRVFIQGLTKFTLDCINVKFGVGLDHYSPEYVKQVKKFFSIYNADDIDCLLQIIEYANKFISMNEAMGDLVITTTAMRIGKIKLLAAGLQNEAEKALKETQAGNKKHVENMKNELQYSAKTAELSDAILKSAFNKEVVEIKGNINIVDTEIEEQADEKSRMLTDEELMQMFSVQK